MTRQGSKEVILGVTGSIAAYKACEIVRCLRRGGLKVTVIMTPEAEKFVSALSFQVLSGNKVYSEMFSPAADWDEYHIPLARRAGLILVAPATANILAKVACGLCDDLLSCVILSTQTPVIFAPAMNETMYKSKAVQDNIRTLKNRGFKFIAPGVGRLACGETGRGCLAPVDKITAEAKKLIR